MVSKRFENIYLHSGEITHILEAITHILAEITHILEEITHILGIFTHILGKCPHFGQITLILRKFIDIFGTQFLVIVGTLATA